MKYIYKSVFLVALGFSSLAASAQKDTTLTRQVMLEREYAPTLNDASRINQTPSVYEYQTQRTSPSFIQQAPAISLPKSRLGKVSPGGMDNEVVRNRKRGYLQAAGGTYGNIEAVAGYRILDSSKDKLDFFTSFDASNAKIKYLAKGYEFEKMKAKHTDFKINANYQHTFKPSILSIDAAYLNTAYNYFGNNFLPPALPGAGAPVYDSNTNQKTNVFAVSVGLQSSKENQGVIKYIGSFGYTKFSNKYGLLNNVNGTFANQEGMDGGLFDANLDLYTELNPESWIGVRGSILNQSFSKSEQIAKDTIHYFTNITANPYFHFEGMNWDVEFGVNASVLFDKKNKFLVTPNIKASLKIHDVNNLYANITGGVNNNTFIDILQENRYASPLGRVKFSRTLYDLTVGFKSGIVPGFQFDVFGGYKHTKDEHLYIASSMLSIPDARWANVAVPVYADLSTGHIGGMVKTELIPYTTLSAKATAYFYSMKNLDDATLVNAKNTEAKPWGKPTFEVGLDAQIKLFDPLTISADYTLGMRRKAYDKLGTVKMKDINELNAKVDYRITDWLTVNARINNLLNQKYELNYGYTLQGFNVLGGFNLKF